MSTEVINQLQTLIEEFTPLISSYQIPKSHEKKFHEFKKNYKYDKKTFFKDVKNIEIQILNSYRKILAQNKNILNAQSLSGKEVQDFLSGEILKKRVRDINELTIVKTEISKLLDLDNEIISRKFLHLLNPVIINFLHKNRDYLFSHATDLFNQKYNVSFELGYFRTVKKVNNTYWHDDYTLFKNKVPKAGKVNSLMLNLHIALSKATKLSSPLCFLKGSENLVYARAALKFLHDNQIKFDENLALKATYLTEELYKPGKKIKPNFIGLLPRYLYILFCIKNLNKKFDICFEEVDLGDYLIFSPHIMHCSPLINRTDTPRESLVFRFFNDDYYNHRNLSTCQKLLEHLSFAKGRYVTLNEVKSALFYDYPKINLNSKIYFNIYLYKNPSQQTSKSYPKIYFEDLWIFFQSQ